MEQYEGPSEGPGNLGGILDPASSLQLVFPLHILLIQISRDVCSVILMLIPNDAPWSVFGIAAVLRFGITTEQHRRSHLGGAQQQLTNKDRCVESRRLFFPVLSFHVLCATSFRMVGVDGKRSTTQ